MNYQVHHGDVNFETHNKYAHVLASAIILISNNNTSPNPDYNFPTTPEIASAIEQLHHSMALPIAPRPNPYDGQDDPSHIHAHEPDDEEFAVHHDSGEFKEEPFVPTLSSGSKRPPSSTAAIQNAIHSLFCSLYTQVPTHDLGGQFFSPLMRFLLLKSLHADGSWSPSGVITQTIAAVLFVGRLTFAQILSQTRSRDPNFQYHTYVLFLTFLHPHLTRIQCVFGTQALSPRGERSHHAHPLHFEAWSHSLGLCR